MSSALLLHAFFSRAPRANPWLGGLERDKEARPYGDDFERAYQECWGPLAAAPLLDLDGSPLDLVNLYSELSFSFEPAVLDWLERRHPLALRLVAEGDRAALRERGHGGALAQPWGQAVLPLLEPREQAAALAWGREAFKQRFNREPEGWWLNGCAVNDSVLELLAEAGAKFTVLHPSQAQRVRSLDGGHWSSVPARMDLAPLLWRSKCGSRTLALFFFDPVLSESLQGPLAREGLRLAESLEAAAASGLPLLHAAVDGEAFGAQVRFGHMGLAAALTRLRRAPGLKVFNYGQYLEQVPPRLEVDVHPGSSAACPHGLGLWTGACACASKTHPGWKKDWKGPFIDALADFASRLDAVYEAGVREAFPDPWKARASYVEDILDPRLDLARASSLRLSPAEARAARRLFELQRLRLELFPSAALSGPDVSAGAAQRVLACAARVVELAGAEGPALESSLLEGLARVPSHLAAYGDAAEVYRRRLRAAAVQPGRAAAIGALADFFEEAPNPLVSGLVAKVERLRLYSGEDRKLWVGQVTTRDRSEESVWSVAILRRRQVDIELYLAELPATDGAEALGSVGAAFGLDDLGLTRACRYKLGEALGLEVLLPEDFDRAARRLLRPAGPEAAEALKAWREARLAGAPAGPALALARAAGLSREDLPGLEALSEELCSRTADALLRGEGLEELAAELAELAHWGPLGSKLELGALAWSRRAALSGRPGWAELETLLGLAHSDAPAEASKEGHDHKKAASL